MRVDIKRVILHMDYKFDSLENDIALLYTRTNMISSGRGRVDAVVLPSPGQSFTGSGNVSGYGHLGSLNRNGLQLYFLELLIIDDHRCSIYNHFNPSVQLCVGHNHYGKETCTGDSGGPFTQRLPDGKFILVSLISFGFDKPCGASHQTIEVHTRVSSFVNWIQSYVTSIG